MTKKETPAQLLARKRELKAAQMVRYRARVKAGLAKRGAPIVLTAKEAERVVAMIERQRAFVDAQIAVQEAKTPGQITVTLQQWHDDMRAMLAVGKRLNKQLEAR